MNEGQSSAMLVIFSFIAVFIIGTVAIRWIPEPGLVRFLIWGAFVGGLLFLVGGAFSVGRDNA